ncbi:hypothetical protein [Intrasporangium flavum]|uniref:hypothetical protein n=1 Tax=Intrasporangium flavum TaxID=1428657 RepID=UPI00096CDECE|nr:hypothetical protein [Intrasporangium flavum]
MTRLVHRPRLRRVTVVAACSAVVALAACSGDPTGAPTPSVAPTSRSAADPAPEAVLDLARAKAAMADYDKRNNAAARGSYASLDPKIWRTADIGPLLLEDDHAVVVRSTTPVSERKPHVDFSMSPEQVFAGADTTLPRLALVAGSGRGGLTASEQALTGVRLMVQTREGGRWFNAQSFRVKPAALPGPALPGTASTAGKADRRRLLGLRQEVLHYLERATRPTHVDQASVAPVRAAVMKVGDTSLADLTVTCMALPDDSPGAFGVWRTQTGLLGALTLRCQNYAQLKDRGAYMNFDARARAVLGIKEKFPQDFTFTFLVQALVAVPESGRATIIAHSTNQVLTR